MAGIYGLSSLVLDNKGRIAMPAKYKEQLRELATGLLSLLEILSIPLCLYIRVIYGKKFQVLLRTYRD